MWCNRAMKRQTWALLAVGLTALPAATPGRAAEHTPWFSRAEIFRPPPAKKGYTYPDCYCTDGRGRRVELGEKVCLTVGGRMFLAECGMSLNNPAWREVEEGCPTA